MDSDRIYAQLQDVCQSLDVAEDHVIAAYIEFAMSLIAEKYGIAVQQADHAPIA